MKPNDKQDSENKTSRWEMLLLQKVAVPVLVFLLIVIAVYLVEYGMGESATVINDISKGWIATVVDDMCDYSTSSGTEVIPNADGTETTQTVLYVNVILKDYHDMISIYNLNETQSELLDIMMSLDSLVMLGYSEGIENGQSSISRAEVNQILSEITNDMQRKTCSYALSKVGYPYSQAYRLLCNEYPIAK